MNESLTVTIKVFYAKYANIQVPTIGDFQEVKNFKKTETVTKTEKRQRQRQRQRNDRDNDKNRDRL